MVLGADHRRGQLRDPARDHCRPRARPAEGALTQQLLAGWTDPVGPDALDAAGRLIADSLICGTAGAPFARSRALRRLSAANGGKGEARVLGMRRALPAASAAMANAESMNLLDADDTFLDIAHFGALVVAVALAEADRVGAGWTRLREAVARGFDLNARLAIAGRPRPGVLAPGLMMLGATMAAACVAGADETQVRQALALAMRTAPAPATRAVSLAAMSTFKYAPYAMLAGGAVQASRLAMAGFVSAADPAFFFEAQQVNVAPGRLGRSAHWWVERTALKPWPSFRLGHPLLDALDAIVRGQALVPDDIIRIELRLDPRALALPFHHWPDPLAVDDMLLPLATAMNLRVCSALVAARIPPGPSWAKRSSLRRADVRGLTGRVVLSGTPAIVAEQLEAERDPATGLIRAAFGEVAVFARGRSWTETRCGADGDEADWDWLRRKAHNFLGSPALVDMMASLPPGALLPR